MFVGFFNQLTIAQYKFDFNKLFCGSVIAILFWILLLIFTLFGLKIYGHKIEGKKPSFF